jgi:uncharacterized protein
MRVDIADLKSAAGIHKTVPLQIMVEPVEFSGTSLSFDRPFTGDAEIWNAGDRLLVKASLAGDVRLQCSRCLSDFELPLSVSFEEEFVEGRPGSADDLDDHGEERSLSYYSGDEIDLSDPLRDSVLVAVPMKPLCKEACEGLCQTCGHNRNEGECQCGAATTVDPRLEALERLLRKPDSNS